MRHLIQLTIGLVLWTIAFSASAAVPDDDDDLGTLAVYQVCSRAPNYADYGYGCDLFNVPCSLSLREFLEDYFLSVNGEVPTYDLLRIWIDYFKDTDYYPCVSPAESQLVKSRQGLFVWAVDNLDWLPKQDDLELYCTPSFLDLVEGYCTPEQLDGLTCGCNKWNEINRDPIEYADMVEGFGSFPGECASGDMKKITVPAHVATNFDDEEGGVTGLDCSGDGCRFDKGYIEESDPANPNNWGEVEICDLETNISGERYHSLNATMGQQAGANAMVSETLGLNASKQAHGATTAAFNQRLVELQDQTDNFASPGSYSEVELDTDNNNLVDAAHDLYESRLYYRWGQFQSYPDWDYSPYDSGGQGMQVDDEQIIENCDEYAYEKFFRYSVHQDFVSKLGSEYRELFNVSLGRSAQDPNETGKIVDANLLDNRAEAVGKTLTFRYRENPHLNTRVSAAALNGAGAEHTSPADHRANSTPPNPYAKQSAANLGGPPSEFIEATIGSDLPVPQNDFFAMEFTKSTVLDGITDYHTGAQIYDILTPNPCQSYQMMLDEPVFKSDEGDLGHPSRNLADDIQNAINTASLVVHDLDWHQDISRRLSKMPDLTPEQIEAHGGLTAVQEMYQGEFDDEQLYAYDLLKDELRRLLGLREELAVQAAMEETMVCENRTLSADEMAEISGVPWRKSFIESGASTSCGGVEFCEPDYSYLDDNVPSRFVGDPNFNVNRLPPKGERALVKLYELDRKLGQLLKTSWDLGCYRRDLPGSPNPCDWSPRVFAEDIMLADIEQQRELALDQCIQVTGGYDFYDMKLYPVHLVGSGEITSTWNTPPPECRATIAMVTPPHNGASGLGDMTLEQMIAEYSIIAPYPGLTTLPPDCPETCSIDQSLCWHQRPMRVYMESTEHFDEFILAWYSALQHKRTQEQKQAHKQIESYNESGKPKADQVEKGNKHLNAYYDYDFDYSLGGIEEMFEDVRSMVGGNFNGGVFAIPDSPLDPTFNAGLVAGLELFGREFDVIDVSASISLSDLSDLTGTVDDADFSNFVDYHFVIDLAGISLDCNEDCFGDGESLKDDLFEAKSRFSIGPIPMSVSCGVTGKMGIDYAPTFDYKLPNNLLAPVDPGSFESNDEYSLWQQLHSQGISESDYLEDISFKGIAGLTVTPYMSLDAYAQVAIDAVILAAGIEARLTVFDMRFPFTAGAELSSAIGISHENLVVGSTVVQVPQLMMAAMHLNFYADLEAHMRFLDGKVSAFAKLNLGFWKKTYRKKLFGWKGPSMEVPIFSYNRTMDQVVDRFPLISDLSLGGSLGGVPCLDPGENCPWNKIPCVVGNDCPTLNNVPDNIFEGLN